MKFFHATIFAVMLVLVGAPMLRAQQPEEKPKQQEEKKPPPAAKEKEKSKPDERAKPEPKPDKEKSKQEPDKAKPQKEQERAPAQERKEQERAPTQQRQPTTERNQGATAERGSHKNVRRIPPERFQASFGREHHFRVQRRDDRHFEYSGYTFEVVEVFPAGWSYDDDCYLEEDGDDYYLVDVVHPELRVLVVIVG